MLLMLLAMTLVSATGFLLADLAANRKTSALGELSDGIVAVRNAAFGSPTWHKASAYVRNVAFSLIGLMAVLLVFRLS